MAKVSVDGDDKNARNGGGGAEKGGAGGGKGGRRGGRGEVRERVTIRQRNGCRDRETMGVGARRDKEK